MRTSAPSRSSSRQTAQQSAAAARRGGAVRERGEHGNVVGAEAERLHRAGEHGDRVVVPGAGRGVGAVPAR